MPDGKRIKNASWFQHWSLVGENEMDIRTVSAGNASLFHETGRFQFQFSRNHQSASDFLFSCSHPVPPLSIDALTHAEAPIAHTNPAPS
jgi:hypothetical protein